jgi:hypothetical protein
LITDAHGHSVTITLDAHSVIPVDVSSLTILNKIKITSENNNLGHRWLRGSLHLNQAAKFTKGSVTFVAAVGTKNSPLVTQMIPKNKETTGAGLHKLVIPNVSSSDAIGHIKTALPEMVGGHSVVFLVCNSHQECEHLKRYLETPFVRYLVKSIKISTPNSKSLFELLPNMPIQWSSSDDLCAQHGLDAAETKLVNQQFG